MTNQEIQEQAENPAKFFLKQKGIHPTEPIYWDLATTTISLDDLLDEYAKWMQERDKWISVEDRLPEMGVCVLVYIDNGLITCAHRSLKEGINTWELYGDMYAIFDLKYNQVTNWKTLPSPPKTK